MNFNPFKGKKNRQKDLESLVESLLKQCPICQNMETRKIGVGAGLNGLFLAKFEQTIPMPLPYIAYQCTRCGYVMIFAEP